MDENSVEYDLCELLKDPSPRVRSLSARLVGKMADVLQARNLVSVMQELLTDSDKHVAVCAEWALQKLKSAEIQPRGGKGGEVISVHGGYQNLKSYQNAEIVCDATIVFCDKYIGKRSRTHDQMVQAARSGKQNIAEGSQASGTSKKTELKLVNVARASLEELFLDYKDFLRQRCHVEPQCR